MKAKPGTPCATFAYVTVEVTWTDHVEMNRRNWDERAAIHARDTTGDYIA